MQRNTRREYRTNDDKDSYKRVLCLSSLYETQRIFSSDFVSSVLILSSFVEDAQNDRVAFEDRTRRLVMDLNGNESVFSRCCVYKIRYISETKADTCDTAAYVYMNFSRRRS